MTNESLMGFVRRLRLERGAQRLKFGTASVTAIALQSGYQSHEAFTRAFRTRFGTSPSRFREDHRATTDGTDIACRTEPARVCVALRHVGDYRYCEQSWGALEERLAAAGAVGRVSVGLVYDDPDVTAAELLRYDACEVFDESSIPDPLPLDCTTRTIPAGRYAVALHRGPYETILSTYTNLLGRWLPFRDYELADEPVVEVYLNEPGTTAPNELRTEVCVRIK